ncbi:MAG: 16S rRNA (cytosine(967)-C(5))-methyltransferase RsmB, partial [Clostridiales bacterium]|nr:16S rRNA (cytosine(967)-C(5))-methyltransferase RsmB [Clostridiales bacterium]
PSQGERKPYAIPAGQSQSGERSFAKPAYGKPAFNQDRPSQGERKPYARPAGQGQGGERGFGKPAYGKPAFNKDSSSQNERKVYGRPAPQSSGGERSFTKPAYGRPAFNKSPATEGERKVYGRPAPQAQGVEGSFVKPAFSTSSAPEGERKVYGRPAPQSSGGEHKPYGRPAPQGQGGERSFARPAYGKPAFNRDSSTQGERKPYSRPAPQGQGGERSFGKPSFSRSAPERSFGRDTYSRPSAPVQNQERFGRPSFRQAGTDDKPFDRSSQSRPSFSRPGAPRPSYNRSSPARTDFRRQGGFSQTSPRNDGSQSADARKSAMLVLNRVLLESGYASLSLDEHFDKVNLSQRDKRLCTRIVYLTLENLNRLDFALDKLLEDPERVEKRVRNILRLSAAQILLLDRVPDSAAVNEAVKLVRELELEDLTGLVNGVLRNLIRGKEDIKWPTKADGLDYYHIMYSLPMWYIQKILEEYGTEEGEKILSYRKDEHHMPIRLTPLRISEEKFEELLSRKTWKSQKGIMPGAFYVTGVSDVAADIDYLDGLFSIQGEGSMMAAEAVQPKLGAQVLDTCAAPGGKSAYLAEMMQGTGRVQAWDIYEHRVELIKAMSERLRHYNIRPAVRDALVYREQLDGLMDAVLIDAPCTGTGVLDDKPDLRHHLNEESLKELIEIQSRLLETCSRYVRTGCT